MTRSDVTLFTVTLFLRFLRIGVAGSVKEWCYAVRSLSFLHTFLQRGILIRHARVAFTVEQGALKPEESEIQAGNLGAEVSKIG